MMSGEPAGSAKGGRVLVPVLVALAVVAGLIAAWIWWPFSTGPAVPSASPHPPDDPRVTFETPYLNVRPNVRSVGDEACGGCHVHDAIAKSFRRHPMGRSLAPMAATSATERLDAGNPFTHGGLQYLVERHGERIVHRETLPNSKGGALAQIEQEVTYVLGSGTRGRSYLINRDGYLFQSPISWYTQKNAWDLSPNYAKENQHFERPINSECLSCHSNYADAVENTINRFREPIFRGHAIGCERCHGPGELHVQFHEKNPNWQGGDDFTIVHPGKLDAPERESVCQQCHLQGWTRVLRAGRQSFDFRPGLPMHLFWSVFIRPPTTEEEQKAVSQVEQMVASKCFRATKARPRGKKSKRLEMGCISCHDPHEEPAPEQRVSYYRDRCLACHAEHGCRLPLEERLEKSKEDSCIACHMPRIGSADIAHTALTDHRILRRPSAGLPLPGPRGAPLVHFHRDHVQPDDQNVARDYGIALVELAIRSRPQAIHFGVQALPILDAAVKDWPDDIPALNARAYALGMSKRQTEGLHVFEEALRKAPTREATLVDAATLTGYYMDRPDLSRPYWQRAVAVNPFNSRYHYEIARLDAVEGNWTSARDACLAALRLNPVHADALQLLTTSYLRLDDRSKAEAQLEILLALKPAEAPELRRWFAEQSR